MRADLGEAGSAHPAGPATVPLRLVLTTDEHMPLYLQIVYQIRHLITNRGLSADDRLPSVRELAQQLGVNSGTVALAYRTLQREGLIESRRGLGTFVSRVADDSRLFDRRQHALGAAVDALLARAAALGFDTCAVKQYLTTRAHGERIMPIVVIASSLRGAEKYARLVSAELPTGVRTAPHLATFDDLEGAEEALVAAYGSAYFTFTFMSHTPSVSARLAELGIESEVVGITGQLAAGVPERLHALDPSKRYAVVCNSHNLAASLNVLAHYSPLDARRLLTYTELTPLRAPVPGVDLYLHSFSALPQLERLGIPAEKRLEITFVLSHETRLRLRRLLDVTGPSGPHLSEYPHDVVAGYAADVVI